MYNVQLAERETARICDGWAKMHEAQTVHHNHATVFFVFDVPLSSCPLCVVDVNLSAIVLDRGHHGPKDSGPTFGVSGDGDGHGELSQV